MIDLDIANLPPKKSVLRVNEVAAYANNYVHIIIMQNAWEDLESDFEFGTPVIS
jgi:hypothetical protein